MSLTYLDTNPAQNDTQVQLLGKLLQLIGGHAEPNDSPSDLLKRIVTAFNGAEVSDPSDFVTIIGDTMTGALNIGIESTDNAFMTFDPDSSSPITLTRRVADNAPAIIRGRKRGTTGDASAAPAVNDNLVRYDFYAWDGSAYNPGVVFQATANENWTGSARGTRLTVNVVANGATSTTEMMRMTAQTLDLRNSAVLSVGGTQVVTARQAGWTAPSGSVSRATFDTATVTTTQLAQRVAALINDLTAHGLIGA